jgi:hypothetical protein
MRKLVCLVAVMVAVVALGIAALPMGEKVVTGNETVVTTGATHVVIRADGTAEVTIFSRGQQYPHAATGDAHYTILAGQPAPFSAGRGIDSVQVVLDDATYCIVSWGSW